MIFDIYKENVYPSLLESRTSWIAVCRLFIHSLDNVTQIDST